MEIPQSIDSAPRDGTVILTDCGFAMYLDQKNWGSPILNGTWGVCDPRGNLVDDSDYGIETCLPKLWTSIPDWIING